MFDFVTGEIIALLFILIGLASIAGFLAGLLGIGGGLVLVPGLYFTFSALDYDQSALMHIAIGTSLATIMATGISSAQAHHKRGVVDFQLMKEIAPGLLFGVMVGAAIASIVDSFWLKCFFVPALIILAALMLLNPKGELDKHLPSWPITAFITSLIGIVSSLMGIGGAAMNVPFMALHRVPIHKAIGTAAAMGAFVAIVGSIGFFLIGLNEVSTDFPPFTYGYINILALAIIMPVTILMAPIGVHVAHCFSVPRLKKIFSIFLFFLAFRMAYEIYPVLLEYL